MWIRGIPWEYWISICSFKLSLGSWGQKGDWESLVMDISIAFSVSRKGILPTPVAKNFGLKGITIFLLFQLIIKRNYVLVIRDLRNPTLPEV
jgi:hypothetical protein